MRRRLFFLLLAALDIAAFHLPGVWLFLFLLFPNQGPPSARDAAFNALLVSAWGLLHSVMARRFWIRAVASRTGEDLVKFVFTLLAGASQCAMLYFWRPVGGAIWRAEGPLYWIFAFLLVGAFGMVFYCSVLLDYLEVIGVRGILRRMRGEPPRRPELCLKGPYRHCRHPVYLACIASLWIGPVMTWGKLEFALLVTVYVLIGTWLEERDIRAALGEPYDYYRAHVPMWIPRKSPWKGYSNRREPVTGEEAGGPGGISSTARTG